MAEENQDATVFQGDDKNIVVTTYSDEAHTTVTDLTGATVIEWVMKKTEVSESDLIAKTYPGGGITINSPPTDGKFTIRLDRGDTLNIGHGTYYHEADVIDAAANETTVLIGDFILKRSGV